jgi:hypothetical protein
MLAHSMAIAASVAALAPRVSIVVREGAKEQMVRANTQAIVAPMKDTEPIGDDSIGQNPCGTVGANGAIGRSEASVSNPMNAGFPGPTPRTRGAVYLLPEALRDRSFAHCSSISAQGDILHLARQVMQEDGNAVAALALSDAIRAVELAQPVLTVGEVH